MSRRRGAVYGADLGERIGRKLVVVVSSAPINRGLRQPICALVTSRDRERSVNTYVPIDPPEGGVGKPSFILCHNLFTLPEERIDKEPEGMLSTMTMIEVGERLKAALDLP